MEIKIETKPRSSSKISESTVAGALSLSSGLFSLMSLCAFAMWTCIALGDSSKASYAAIGWNGLTHVICGVLFVTAFLEARKKRTQRSATLFFSGLFVFCRLTTLADK
ncbi:MAG: hypothetical protein AAF802_31160 [Planctomycetota bacterium]